MGKRNSKPDFTVVIYIEEISALDLVNIVHMKFFLDSLFGTKWVILAIFLRLLDNHVSKKISV